MKKSEFFRNLFPLEDLFTKSDETHIQDIVNYCDYTIEANKICVEDDFAAKVNTADAAVFYQMGYEAAVFQVSKRLVPVENCK